MIKIKFSHHYCKMPPDYKISRLTGIDLVRLEDLSGKFLDDDTRIAGGGYYPLPKRGRYMILWLESSIMNVRWQTIRRWTIEKENFYQKHMGELCDIEIKKAKDRLIQEKSQVFP